MNDDTYEAKICAPAVSFAAGVWFGDAWSAMDDRGEFDRVRDARRDFFDFFCRKFW